MDNMAYIKERLLEEKNEYNLLKKVIGIGKNYILYNWNPYPQNRPKRRGRYVILTTSCGYPLVSIDFYKNGKFGVGDWLIAWAEEEEFINSHELGEEDNNRHSIFSKVKEYFKKGI